MDHALGVQHGGRHHQHRTTLGEGAEPGDHERGGCLGHRQGACSSAKRVEHDGLVSQEGGERAEAHHFRLRVQRITC